MMPNTKYTEAELRNVEHVLDYIHILSFLQTRIVDGYSKAAMHKAWAGI